MIFNSEWKIYTEIIDKTCLEMVSDAAISSVHIANGKNIPLIILDTTHNKEVENAIFLHSNSQSGRASTLWGKRIDNKLVTLTFRLIEPSSTEFIVPFNAEKHSGLIELIINSQLLYIQCGKPGDRFKDTLEEKRILVEVPSTHFKKEWDKIYSKAMTKHFRKFGLSKKNSKIATQKLRSEWGKIRDFRIK